MYTSLPSQDGRALFVKFYYSSLSQYVKILVPMQSGRLIVVIYQLSGIAGNQKPTTGNQKLKVIIAAGLTSSHLEQRS